MASRLFRRKEKLKTSQGFGKRIKALFSGGRLDPESYQALEATLLGADVGHSATQEILDQLRTSKHHDHLETLQQVLSSLLANTASREIELRQIDSRPRVIMVVGVNGAGKTTSVAKLAHYAIEEGSRVVVAAADTFRAAAVEQLSTWAARVGADVVSGGNDPAAVAFDAIKLAKEKHADLVIVDTAGRLHTKTDLMNELGKIQRVIEKQGPVDEILLVIDATTGQNGIMQAKVFAESVKVSGVILTKLDGSAKGGIVISIQRDLGIPVKFVGLGEEMDDLAPFEPELFVEGLFT